MRWAEFSGGLADDGHAGGVGTLGLAYGEGDDVDAETAEEAGDAGEDAGLVLDEGYEGVEHRVVSSRLLVVGEVPGAQSQAPGL